MTEDPRRGSRIRMRLAWAFGVLIVILCVIIVPPLVNVGRYQGRITRLISASLGRPVRLSSVELRLLPRPGFVLTDLTVDEDPAYGAEPVLHANTVTASIRILSLWRGLEISRISVDEASLNLVRTTDGHWNVESLFRSAAGTGGEAPAVRPKRAVPLPYLEATSSRINVKDGAEKLPYSLINSDLSFWQDDPGHWRIRLRGQPARTDLSIDPADTGIVRLEADLHRAPELRQIPMHVDMEWREAQLGQLTRLLVGSDAGWRGDLTGELHLDGTPDAARIRTRLRAAGVHRAEFAPVAPMDFDATCALVYHYSSRAMDDLECNSPLGDGRIRLTGNLPGESAAPKLAVELDGVPINAALDALRTVRSGIGPGLAAQGTVSGKITYAQPVAVPAVAQPGHKAPIRQSRIRTQPPAGPLSGSLTIDGLQLTGDGLEQPIHVARVIVEAASGSADAAQNNSDALMATTTIPSGGPVPLSLSARLALTGYEVSLHGQSSIAHLRELARIAGVGDEAGLDALSGDPANLDFTASGPWIVPETTIAAPAQPQPDQVTGTLTLHNAAWRAEFLANPIEISQATLHADAGLLTWDPVAFAYGPVMGTGKLSLPVHCEEPQNCRPQFELQFGTLDAAVLEAAVLGAHEQGTLLSELIARLSPSRPPSWPELQGTVKTDSLALGPITLQQPTVALRILPDGAEVTALDAGLFGGKIHMTGSLHAAGTHGNSTLLPAYSLEGRFEQVSPAQLGQLLGMRWSGGQIDGDGNLDLSGYTSADLAASASGTLRFDWRHGAVSAGAEKKPASNPESSDAAIPAALAHFDRWTAEAAIAKGAITLQQNTVQHGPRQATVTGSAAIAAPITVNFTLQKAAQTARR
jgi:uncharacterized protein involved in outer membrane biogenesis